STATIPFDSSSRPALHESRAGPVAPCRHGRPPPCRPRPAARPASTACVVMDSVLHPRGDGAVDDEVGAAYERSRLAGEEGDAGGDLLRRAHAAHRIARERALVAFGAGITLAAPGVAILEDRAG